MGNKRKNPYRYDPTRSKGLITPGTAGLFFTCSGNDNIAFREANNIIDMAGGDVSCAEVSNPIAAEGQASEAAVSSSEDEDVADSIKRFCKQAKEQKQTAGGKPRVLQLQTGARHCIFIAVSGPQAALDLADKIYTMASEKPCCRYLQRVLPFETTCKVDLVNINQEISKLIARHFVVDSVTGKWPTYSVEFKARNNDEVKRTDILRMADEAISGMAPSCRVNLGDPDVSLLVQVVQKRVFLSCIKKFVSRKKLSLHKEEKDSDVKAAGKGDDSVKLRDKSSAGTSSTEGNREN